MLVIGYIFLGTLVGVLVGLTSSPIVGAFVTAIFTFIGGGAAYYVKEKPEDRNLVGGILAGFSLGCLIGLFGGLYVKENRSLANLSRIEAIQESAPSIVDRDLLRSYIDILDSQRNLDSETQQQDLAKPSQNSRNSSREAIPEESED